MSKVRNIILILALLLMGYATAGGEVAFSINLGAGDYYQPVGDYDYLPYAYQATPGFSPPRFNFHDMMSQYGVWVSISPFGQVWKPYASNDWRPYTYGHWISTQQYGQMWEGYEPWAWAGYHYGNWIYTPNYGWVWIPGYEWHPGRVSWARSYDSIGWMPSPPSGYDYSRGYLSNVGPNNQFGYSDSDFGAEFGSGNFGYGGPYYDSRYRDSYYNPAYNKMSFNLWVFINNANYGHDNYAGYALGPEYTRHVFDRRIVRIANHQIDRSVVERVVGQRLRETEVQVRQLQTEKQTIRVIVPADTNALERVRKQSKDVVRQIIAPGFAEKQKEFKGQGSRNKEAVSRIFRQQDVKPKLETLTSDQIAKQAREESQIREQSRIKREQAEKEKLDRIEKEGKIHEPKKGQDTDKADLQKTTPQSGGEIQKDSGKDSKEKSKDKSKDKDKDKSKDKDKDKDKNQDQDPPSR